MLEKNFLLYIPCDQFYIHFVWIFLAIIQTTNAFWNIASFSNSLSFLPFPLFNKNDFSIHLLSRCPKLFSFIHFLMSRQQRITKVLDICKMAPSICPSKHKIMINEGINDKYTLENLSFIRLTLILIYYYKRNSRKECRPIFSTSIDLRFFAQTFF